MALLFPAQLTGAIGMAIVASGLGVAVARGWPELPEKLRRPPPAIATAVVVVCVIACGLDAFWDTLATAPDWQIGDWGPHHAVISRVLPAMPSLDPPVWNHAVGTGDAPFELYPQVTSLVVANLAGAFDLDVPWTLMIVAVCVHLGLAVLTTLIAIRVAPRPIALVVGLMTIVESGAVAHGGTVGMFRWALLHSLLSLAFGLVAVLGILAMLRRPRTRAAIAIWVGTALACMTHPIGLVAAAANVLGLTAVALLAADVPPRRALVAIGHVILGVALGAWLWMPLAERILLYGQHFPNPLHGAAQLLEQLLQQPSPVTAFALLGYAGYFGIIAGLWSRQARTVFLAAGALVLVVGLCDVPYRALDLMPGLGVSRLGTERLAQLARPLLAACGAYGISIVLRHAIARWRDAPPRSRLVAAAVIGLLSALVLRVAPMVWRSASTRAYVQTLQFAPDPGGRAQLVSWAHQRAAEIGPATWARALFETRTHEHFHLTAETGLPSFHLSPQPDFLLRERIEDLSEESLRRFNVRWVIAEGDSPGLGDPATELRLGNFVIRELASWDGKFARIERGQGEVKVTRLDDAAVEIEVTATEPVLVALGTGYYPRWRARHASGKPAPVYAMPATSNGQLHVVSAWVEPGKTTFTVDGPLPSDGKGSGISILALVAVVAGAGAWQVKRLRIRVLRRLARLRAGALRHRRQAVRVVMLVLLLSLLVRGCVDERRAARHLALGSGVRAVATVEARVAGGAWLECDYHRLEGSYVCDGVLIASDGTANLLNDAPPSWALSTPAITASADVPGVEIRVTLRERLDGVYWSAVSHGTVALEVSGEPAESFSRKVLTYSDGDRAIEIRGSVPTTGWQFTFVREDTLFPARPHLRPPPLR